MYRHPVSLEPPFTTYDHSPGQGGVGVLYSSKPDMVETCVPSTLQVRPSSKDGFKSAQGEQRVSHRQAIVALSHQRFCLTRGEVEAMLSRERETQPHDSFSKSRAGQARDNSETPSQVALSSDQWRMLEHLADHPDDAVKSVYRALGFSNWRGAKVRHQLRDQSLVLWR